MNTVNVKIDITSPTGRKLLREIEKHPKAAKIEYPMPDAISGNTYTHDDVWTEIEKKFNEHYGTNHKFK